MANDNSPVEKNKGTLVPVGPQVIYASAVNEGDAYTKVCRYAAVALDLLDEYAGHIEQVASQWSQWKDIGLSQLSRVKGMLSRLESNPRTVLTEAELTLLGRVGELVRGQELGRKYMANNVNPFFPLMEAIGERELEESTGAHVERSQRSASGSALKR